MRWRLMTELQASSAARLARDDEALLLLLRQLQARGYHFITPTPATHAHVIARPSHFEARDLRDIFGWSLPFAPETLDPELLKTLLGANALEQLDEGRLRSRYRISTRDGHLFLHSAYPTDAEDAIFFGPDSYRFANLVCAELGECELGTRLVDIGAGTGVGAIVAAQQSPELHITMTDINPHALRVARINARHAGVEASYVLGADLDPVDGPIGIALANPPYIIDAEGRNYRDGGDMHGARVAYDMAIAASDRLSQGGRFILYTGSAIIRGEDALRHALSRLADQRGLSMRYREIDPDVFGEELAKPAYGDVERIAVVAAVLTKI